MITKCFTPELSASFNLTLSNLLSQITDVEGITPVRVTFFSDAEQDEELEEERQAVRAIINDHFGDSIPTWNLIGQSPICTNHTDGVPEKHFPLAAEVSYLECDKKDISFRMFENRPYVVTELDGVKKLYVSGIRNNYTYDVIEQCEETFAKMHRLLKLEQMPINSIVRQWNYVRKIVGVVGEFQNYQQFNDARSYFYDQTQWPEGYPAATGIGVICGKISVDFDAATGLDNVKAIDNLLQVAAHVYSQEVLIGKQTVHKRTPKFERAKIAGDTLYISGTASIRGEDSIGWDDIDKQTIVTLENIEHLVEQAGTKPMEAMRAYIKRPELVAPARKIIEERYPDIEAVYVISDVCRDELLIEIEALAYKA